MRPRVEEGGGAEEPQERRAGSGHRAERVEAEEHEGKKDEDEPE
jgi:hypothetical protein